ncbi:MAG: cell wall-binding repeat-containing protein [Bacillota bacterium]
MRILWKSLAFLMFIGILVGGAANVSANDDFTVNVRLTNSLGTAGSYDFVPRGSSQLKEDKTVQLEKGVRYSVHVSSGKLVLKSGSKTLKSGLATVTVEPVNYSKANHLYLYKSGSTTLHPYMGTIKFRMSGTTKIQPVNSLHFEDYLKGVVPSESPASWGANGGMESLKAQAITARSYIFAKMNQSSLEIDDTTTFQVFKGFIWDPLSPRYQSAYQYTNRAVDETQGQILTYRKADGQKGFVTAYFSASNGGQTELPEQFWTSKLPYLSLSQKDEFDTGNVVWKLNWLKNQLPANIDLMAPATWWQTTAELNLNGSLVNEQSKTAFTNFKKDLLAKAKAKDPSVESIKISSIDKIQTENFDNTGKVKSLTVEMDYYVRRSQNGALNFDMAAGAASKTLSGKDRYETAVQIAQETVGAEKAPAIVLGRGDVPADALAGTVLAHKHNAPILLTKRNSLPIGVEMFLKEQTKQGAPVYLLGGTYAISEEIEQQLKREGFTTIRLAGKTRSETSLKIAEEIGQMQTVMFATGNDNSSDALSASAYAAVHQLPIIIHMGAESPESTLAFLENNSTEKALLIGGASVVPDAVAGALADRGIESDRISGKDRVETSLEINRLLPMNGKNLVVGNAHSFVDALAGSVLAAKTNSPILLLHPDPNRLPKSHMEQINKLTKEQAYYLGGESVISAELKTASDQYIGSSLKKHRVAVTYEAGSTPSITNFRTLMGGANLKSIDFDMVETSDRFIMDGSGFGHGIGMSQWGSYRRSQAGQSAQQILNFYYQGVSIEHTSQFVK